MIALIYQFLLSRLPTELVDIIVDYYKQLLLADVRLSLKNFISSYSITMEPHFNNSTRFMSRRVTRNRLNNHLIITQYYNYVYNDLVYNRYQYHDGTDVHIQKSYQTSSKRLHMQADGGQMNRKRRWLINMHEMNKEQLMEQLKINKVKCYKSWTKNRLITALLKA